MAEKSNCKRCDRGLADTARSAGRARSYCSTKCRRAVENDIRRTTRKIARLRVAATKIRAAIAQGDNTYFLNWGRPREALPLVETKLAEVERAISVGRR
jgi:hypothetical protein